MTRCAGVLVLLVDEMGVWLAQRRDIAKDYCGMWAAPGGALEPDEEVHEAAFREVEEETGILLEPEQLTYVGESQHTDARGEPFMMHQFRARLRPAQVPCDTEPHKQGLWFWISPVTVTKYELTPGTAAAFAEWLKTC